MSERKDKEVRENVHEVKEQAQDIGQRAKERGEAELSQRKEQFSGVVSSVGAAVQRAGDELKTRGQGEAVGGYLDNMAQRINDFSHYLDNHDWRAMVDDAQKLAGKQPEIFLGGMFVAGLAMGRFLKASEHEQRR